MKHIRGNGRATVALVVVLAVLGMLTAGCVANKVAVKAVARAVPSPAPFFKKLGKDIAIGTAISRVAGEVGGGAPGLYGGTRNAGHCDKGKLVDFLQKPQNRDKAKAWAKVKGLDGVGAIKGYVRKLTPVLLRGDTLVKNHDFKKGKADAFDALLEAGIAVLVDELGRPAVQCSCGNPLTSFTKDIDQADVEFDSRNKKWPSYDSDKVAKVKAAPKEKQVKVYQLVDVEDPDAGLAREAGSDGTEDEVLPEPPDPDGQSVTPSTPAATETGPEAETTTVPGVLGMTLADAKATLEAEGFQVSRVDALSDTDLPGTVIAQSPDAETEAPYNSLVTLTVASDGTGTEQPPITTEPTTDDPGTDDPETGDPVGANQGGDTEGFDWDGG